MTKRRDFIKTGVMGTAGIAIGGLSLSAKSYNSVIGANDRINLALIGIRNQGAVHIGNWSSIKDSDNVVLKTICDTDERLFDSRTKLALEKGGTKPATEWDLRKVFEDKDIHAVSIVTPNHWHALATIWACQAGKHVYVEKPASYNIWEGKKMIEAARKYNVFVQVGKNNRSSPNVREAIKFIHDGGIGEVFMARGLCYKARDSYGIAKDSQPPAGFHYDIWLGPAPMRPYNEKKGHYNWHWYWDTGNGDTGNTGPHQLDIARWGLKKDEHPVSVYSTGGLYGLNKEESAPDKKTPGKLVYGDVEAYGKDKTSQETPNTQTCSYRYKDGTLLEFETGDATQIRKVIKVLRSEIFSTVPMAILKFQVTHGKLSDKGKKSHLLLPKNRLRIRKQIIIGILSKLYAPGKKSLCIAISVKVFYHLILLIWLIFHTVLTDRLSLMGQLRSSLMIRRLIPC